jgi:hypothetical protein
MLVVVAGVEGDVVNAPGLCERAHDVECLIAIEGRHFDSDHVFYLNEADPKLVGEADDPPTEGCR